MATDITRIINELNRTLNNIYEISKRIYDVYLDENPRNIEIPYTDVNNNQANKTLPNVSKIYKQFEDIVNNLNKHTSIINLIPDPGFVEIGQYLYRIITKDSNIDVTVDVQTLTANDKVDIALLFDYNIFESMVGTINKLVITVSNSTGIPSDIKLLHFGRDNPFVNVFHQNSIKYGCIYRMDGGKWTNDITSIKPTSRTPESILEFDIGKTTTTFELVFPYAYSIYNNGLPVSFTLLAPGPGPGE